ncbi:hypothetical protein ACJRO7_020034 [Eucalyptus globulus]|uniref:Uncharacterized protein n=1 Tax=Eucalyptus globulus TaxID=34317 RepID=A0ABD3KKE3_EUCGL
MGRETTLSKSGGGNDAGAVLAHPNHTAFFKILFFTGSLPARLFSLIVFAGQFPNFSTSSLSLSLPSWISELGQLGNRIPPPPPRTAAAPRDAHPLLLRLPGKKEELLSNSGFRCRPSAPGELNLLGVFARPAPPAANAAAARAALCS